MKQLLLLLGLMMGCFGVNAQAQPAYAYSTAENNQLFQTLITHRDTAVINPVVRTIKADPNQFIPPVLFALSNVLYERGEPETGLYYFCLAQLRASYDANLAVDDLQRFTHKMVTIYETNFGHVFTQFATTHPRVFTTTIYRVLKFVKHHKGAYNHHWIYLDGVPTDRLKKLKQLTKPKSDWPEIKRMTIQQYRDKILLSQPRQH